MHFKEFIMSVLVNALMDDGIIHISDISHEKNMRIDQDCSAFYALRVGSIKVIIVDLNIGCGKI